MPRVTAIDLEDFRPVAEPPSGPVNVIFTARMVREKGVCDLVEAAELLKPAYASRLRFLLCGRITPNKSGITEEYMREHCDGRYICWLGERDDVKTLLEMFLSPTWCTMSGFSFRYSLQRKRRVLISSAGFMPVGFMGKSMKRRPEDSISCLLPVSLAATATS